MENTQRNSLLLSFKERSATPVSSIENAYFYGEGGYRVLFAGNSITLHGPAPEIGWNGEWGMAASAPERDYVRLVCQALTLRHGSVSYCVCQAADWERNWREGRAFYENKPGYIAAADFCADLIIIRLTENVAADASFDPAAYKSELRSLAAFFGRGGRGKLIYTGPFWAHPGDASVEETAREDGCPYVPLSDLGARGDMRADGLFSHAGVAAHPGDAGMRAIADRILAAI